MSCPHDYDDNYETSAPLETRVGLHQAFSINPYGWHRWMLDELALESGSTVVEIGCGTGVLWSAAEPLELDGIELHLLDKSPAMLDAAARTLADRRANVRFEVIDLDDRFTLPGTPAVVIANHVLYHVQDPRTVLTRIRDQVGARTRCVFATNGTRNMRSLGRFLPPRLQEDSVSELIANFTLETGYRHVRDVFGSARVQRYADGLQLTDSAPLIAYLESLPLGLSAAELRSVRVRLDEDLDEHGAVFIEKDVGYIDTGT